MLGFTFYGFSCSKSDLHNKYIVNFKFGWFYEQDHLLNLFILGVYEKDDLNVHVLVVSNRVTQHTFKNPKVNIF